MSVAKSRGELTGREFHWGLVAGLAGGVLGDIFSSNSAAAQQKQAEQNANAQTQAALQQQEQYIAQQAAAQRAAYQSAASQGNPYLQAAGQAQKPNPTAYAPPKPGGEVFGGASPLPMNPQQLAQAYQQSGQRILAPQQPNQQQGILTQQQRMIQPTPRRMGP